MSGFVLRGGHGGDVVVRDGRIAADADGLPVIDVDGLYVGPGFIDSHTHPLSWSRQLSHTSLAHVRTIPEALAELRAACARTPEGDWLVASELGEGRNLAEQRLPLRSELDGVSTGHKIFVAGGTLAAVNSVALAAAGLDDPSREIDGGRVELDDDRVPTGVLLGRGAIDLVRELIPRPTFEQDQESLSRYTSMLAARGVTAVTDYASVDYVSSFAEDWAVYDATRRDGRLSVRTRLAYRIPVGADIDDAIGELRESGVAPDQGEDDLLRAGPLKVFYDGGVQGALLRTNYATRSDYQGLHLLECDALERLTRHAADTGWQLSVHALGGRAIDEVLATWQRIDRDMPLRGKRFSLQHAFDPSSENIRACDSLGVVVGVQQSLFYMFADNMLRHWGRDTASIGLNPLRSWRDAGVALAGGSDIAPFDPLTALWGICTRTTEAGNVVGVEQAVGPAEALAIHTTGAAYGMCDEHRIGSLEPGKLADIVILSDDPASTAPERLRELEVVSTFVGGKSTFLSPSAPERLTQAASSSA